MKAADWIPRAIAAERAGVAHLAQLRAAGHVVAAAIFEPRLRELQACLGVAPILPEDAAAAHAHAHVPATTRTEEKARVTP